MENFLMNMMVLAIGYIFGYSVFDYFHHRHTANTINHLYEYCKSLDREMRYWRELYELIKQNKEGGE